MKADAKIFLTDYASYNAQFKHGHWVDLAQFNDVDELEAYFEGFFESIGITDYEGFPHRYYSESYDHALMVELFEFFDMQEKCHNPEALEAWVNEGYDPLGFEDAYIGEYASPEDFAQSMAEECEYITGDEKWPFSCIDWKWAARELMYDYIEINGYYFRLT